MRSPADFKGFIREFVMKATSAVSLWAASSAVILAKAVGGVNS